ncbi:MAG TPA: DUF945 family protein [Guyparkeria sp.]|nr:DUF945 family protein [Guyparkeria sp.]
MKRLILAVVAVLAATVAAAPLVTGHVMETTLAEAGYFPGTRGVLSLELTDYQRGYLESQARSELVIRLPEQEPIRLELRHRIDQLPGLDGRYATVHTRWQLQDPELRDELAQVFGHDVEFTLATALYLTGGTRSIGHVPAIERDGAAFSGADLKLLTTADRRFEYTLATNRFVIDDQAGSVRAGGQLSIEDLRLTAAGQVADDGFPWESQGRLKVGRIQVIEPAGRSFIDHLSIGVDTGLDDDLWGFSVDYQIGEAAIEGESFHDAQLRLAVERLDVAALRVIARRIESLQELDGIGVDIDVEQAVDQVMRDELPALLNRGPRLAIEPAKVTTVEGDTEVMLSVEVPGGILDGEPNPLMWMAMIGALVLEGSLQMPVALLEKQAAVQGRPGQIQELLAPLIEQGWVEIEDDVLKTSVDFRQGSLKLNGKSANQLLGMAFGG